MRVELVVADGVCTVQPGPGPAPRVNGVTINGPTRLGDRDVLELGAGRRWQLSPLAEDDGSQA